MAPEQVLGAALDARANLSALAAMLFEMLSGKVAFRRPIVDVLHRCCRAATGAIRRPPGRRTDRAIHKALQKRPADRFDSAVTMAAAIARRLPLAIRASSRRWRRAP